MPRVIVHLDADAFFASVEQAADCGKAIAVGGEKHGIIASASYEARTFGVYTPMPTVRARKLRPRLIVVPGDFDKYEHFSRWMFSYAQDFTPDVEIGSIAYRAHHRHARPSVLLLEPASLIQEPHIGLKKSGRLPACYGLNAELDYSMSKRLALLLPLIARAFLTLATASMSMNQAAAQSGSCATNNGGVAAWWAFEDAAADAVATNHGILFGASVFISGVVGRALRFDGGHDYVRLPASPSLDLGTADGFTIEFWIRADVPEAQEPIIEWNGDGRVGLRMWTSYQGGPGCVHADITTTIGWSNPLYTPSGLLGNTFQHIALTYDKASGFAALYANGQESASRFIGQAVAETRSDVYLGRRPGQNYFFGGALDELTFYRRALTATEVLAIATAGNAGKCHAQVPPRVTRQPQPVNAFVGDTVSFDVAASGFQPFSFQWFRDSNALSGQSNAALLLANVQLSDAGDYSVRVSNAEGTAVSSNATLTVRPIPPCAPPATGLLAWWPLEGAGDDFVGTNHIVFTSGTAFVPSAVGRGVLLDRTNNSGRLAASSALDIGTNAAGFTIELWANPVDGTQVMPLIEWNNNQSTVGLQLWTSVGQSGAIYANVIERSGAGHAMSSPPGLLSNGLAHVALTYDRTNGLARLFVNGQQVALANLGNITPETRTDVFVGYRPQGTWRYGGELDEVSLYDHPLSGNEIAALSSAVRAGKCRAILPPRILQQPVGVSIFSGETAQLDARVAGDGPLGYRWFLNGTFFTNTVGGTLLLSNVPLGAAGDYRVAVTNAAGAVTSQVAHVTVIPAPVCVSAPAGIVGWWPLDGGADDVVGENHGVLLGGPLGTTGMVRQALSFDRVDDAIRVPASPTLNLGTSNGFTIELWVKPTDVSLQSPLVEWNDGSGQLGLNLWIGTAGAGSVSGNLADVGGTSHVIETTPAAVTNGGFSHVALTYNRSNGTTVIYINGQARVTRTLGMYTVETRPDVQFGRRPRVGGGNEFLFSGVLDEIALYGRALSASEIAGIYNAQRAGKCLNSVAPRIVNQPLNQTAFAGDTTALGVGAAGPPPLTYQWFYNGALLPGAAGSSLLLPNITTNQAGLYSVSVSNAGGLVMSSNAALTVLTGATCVALPAGASAWWPMQYTGDDFLGTNRLIPAGGPVFVPGRAGLGVRFDGQNDSLRAPASPVTDLGTGSVWTIEFWAKPNDATASKPLLEWYSSGNNGLLIWTSFGNSRGIHANLIDTGGTGHPVTTPSGLISNAWAHVALTYDKTQGMAALYVNGELATNQLVGTFTPRTQYDLFFGQRPGFGPSYTFDGVLDEVTFYRRVLSAAEIRAIFAARDAGKCRAPILPTFLSQPQPVTVFFDEPITFVAEAIGDTPLTYQWLFNGSPLAGRTNTSLVLSNVTFEQAGDYALQVSNVGGAATSAVASLVVLPIPPCVTPPSGLIAWWPLDGDGTDRVANNNALLIGNPRFARGKVSAGLLLDGLDDAGRVPAVPALNLGYAPGLTIELWVLPVNTIDQSPLVEWSTGQGLVGVQLWSAVGGPGRIHANLFDAYGNSHAFATPSGIVTNRLHHVALTYDRASGIGAIFVDGRLAVAQTIGSFPLETRYDVHFGRRPKSGPQGELSEYLFSGVLDEIAFYARALGSNEIAAIAAAGPGGKCHVTVPPAFNLQPESANVFQGDSVTFTARAVGAPPLRYQWRFNGSALAGKTNTSLVLSNVSTAVGGNYSVSVTGPTGVTASSNALLVVSPLTGCVAPSGLVGWWPLDGTPTELLTDSPGTLTGNASFPPGLVGPALRLDGIDDALSVTASSNFNVGLGPGFTIEAWIFPEDAIQPRPVLEWNNRLGGVGVALWISTGDANTANAGRLFANIIDTSAVAHRLISPANGIIVQGRWQHIALTYDKTNGVATLYRDAVVVAQTVLGQFTPQTGPQYDLFFGWRYGPGTSGEHFFGSIDEVGIYGRVLSPSQILALYRAYADGKCKPVEPPTIIASPQPLGLPAGAPAVFEVTVSGAEPLRYQWFRNGVAVTGATNAALALNRVRSRDAGDYFVVVTNIGGRATSQIARLEVTIERTLAALSPADQFAGGLVAVPLEFVSQGEVGGMTLSLHYDPNVLSFSDVAWGNSVESAARQSGVPQAGEVRLVFALPGTAIPTGTQTLAVAQFRARTAPTDTASDLVPEVLDAVRPSGQLLGFGTDVLPGVVRVFAGGGLGDNNGNNRQDLGDVTLLLRLLGALDPTRPWDVSRNDLNLNGQLDSGDAIQLLRFVLDNPPPGADAFGKAAADSPADVGRAVLRPITPLATNGAIVTIQVRLEGLAMPPAGALFAVDYPTNAVRLLDSQSISAGPLVSADATIAWHLAPARTNFMLQTGRIVFAASASRPWPASDGVLAEFAFHVQPGVSNQLSWPITLSFAEVTPDGYETRALNPVSTTLFSSPVPTLRDARFHPSSGFEFWLEGVPGFEFRIEASSNLVHWVSVTNLLLDAGTFHIVDPTDPSQPNRFYRARLVQ